MPQVIVIIRSTQESAATTVRLDISTSLTFTQSTQVSAGQVLQQKAGEGPYGFSGIASLDRYYHRSSIRGRLTARDNVHELLSCLCVYEIGQDRNQSARARLSTSPADGVSHLL